jgi:hypothetical protein
MTRRTLALHRETLVELGTAELSAVNGAAVPTTPAKDCVPATTANTINVCFTQGIAYTMCICVPNTEA